MTEPAKSERLPTPGRMEQAIREAILELKIIDTVRFGETLMRHILPVHQELTERVLESAIDVGYKAIADCHGVEGINATLQTFVSRLRALKAGPR